MIKKIILAALGLYLSVAHWGGETTKPESPSPAPTFTTASHITLSGTGDVAVATLKSIAKVKQASRSSSLSAGGSWSEPFLNYGYLRKAWATAGRDWIRVNSGIKFNDVTKRWEIDPTWPYANSDVAQRTYNVESAAQGAISMASTCRDPALLDEMSAFYLAYAKRFNTLGTLRRMQESGLDTSLLEGQGDDSTRTLVWIESAGNTKRVRECVLCNSQFFHPAARVIRIIAALPSSQRTLAEKQFVSLYAPLIVRDHLLRLLFQSDWNYWEDKTLPKHLVDIWTTMLTDRTSPKLSYQRGMFDWDLWLIATSAEILGANARDPQLVPLQIQEKLALHRAVDAGIKLFRKKRTVYPETKNLQGEVVGSASYFNGDFVQHPEYAYAGYSGSSFPLEGQKHFAQGVSWDISHFYRVPIFLRSMYDNRKKRAPTRFLVREN